MLPVKRYVLLITLFLVPLTLFADTETGAAVTSLIAGPLPWWGWASLLFVFTSLLGVIAVVGGVGGGVLFVPIVSAVFPFHFDFVRGAGLMVALCGALSAGPRLLKGGLASMRLGLPMALLGSLGSIGGAFLGLALPTETVEAALGLTILGIVVLMLSASRSSFPDVQNPDLLGQWLGIRGRYIEQGSTAPVEWRVHRTALGLLVYLGIGILGGMFGLGAGWANVPALNLLLGAPLRVSVATSGFIMSLNSSAAAWVYVNGAAVLPLVTVPSVAGMMIGARVGARVLPLVPAHVIRWVVIALLTLAGARSLIAGILEMVR
jgi:uncharacterized membrane protein YfcA